MADSKRLVDNQELLGGIYEGMGFPAITVPRLLARRSDPETSQAGARDVAKRMGEVQQRAFDAIQAHPGKTCAELEDLMGVRGHTYGRRLGGMEEQGRVRRCEARICSVTGRSAATWRVV